jgi:hypothetical protein
MFVSSRTTRLCVAAAITAALGGAAACSSSDSPTSPTPTANGPAPQTPSPTPAPAPAVGALEISVNPNPVPHSGAPITDAAGCRDVRYTWFYDQVFRETGGSTVTLTNRVDLFDERETNNVSNLNIVVSANGTNQIRSRWCSSNRSVHSAQTRWSGTDANGRSIVVMGPKVTLSAP